MAINPDQITVITKEAYSALKSKALGGVSKESAQSAISEAVNKAVRLGEEAVGKVQQEMQALKGKTAKEIADITSQKDIAVFSAKQEAAEAIKKAKDEAAEAIKKAKATKTAEKILPNGNKEIRKVNKNGAVMVKEYNAAGQLLKSNVTTLDGSIRRTSYNPITGKPVKTFTNTSGEDMLIEYQDAGKTKMIRVNNKKVKPQKPTLVSQTQPQYVKSAWMGESGTGFERIYSDGSKEKITKFVDSCGNSRTRTVLERYDKDGKLVYDKTVWSEGNTVREHIYKEGRKISKESGVFNGQKYIHEVEDIYDKQSGSYVVVKAKKQMGDEKTVFTALKDEFGFYKGTYRAKTTYPKDSGKKPVILEVAGGNLPCVY